MKVIVTAFLMSFGIFAQATDLNVSVGPQSPYILPVALRSCYAEAASSSSPDLHANTIEYSRFQYSWKGTNTFTMQAIVLSFQDSNIAFDDGKYSCIIAGNELNSVLPAGGKTIYPSDISIKEAKCSLRCGGLSFVSTAPSNIQIHGQMRIIGTEIDSNGNSIPVNTYVPISMTYEKF